MCGQNGQRRDAEMRRGRGKEGTVREGREKEGGERLVHHHEPNWWTCQVRCQLNISCMVDSVGTFFQL